jgi:hypothetical protein
MASTYTTNKKLEQPANNDYVGNWNLPVNADWSTIDTCFGGYQVLNPTGLSGTVALTSSTSGTQPYTTTAQWQAPNIVIGASLTSTAALTANVNYQLPSGIGGIWSIYNNTTGAFTVTFSSAGGGSSVVLPQGYRIKVVSDGTNVQVAQTSSTSFALSSALRFLGATSGYMGFQGPATGNNTTWTLPSTDGAAGQVLSTNGSATLSWVSVGASALTAGSVLFANASGQIAQNNAQFYWDNTNNYLGIGTTSPSGPLEVVGATNSSVFSTGTAGYGSFYARGSGTNASYLFMGNVTNGEQGRISTFNTGIITFSNTPSIIERMRIDNNGNVGIGTTTPLSIAGYGALTLNGSAGALMSFSAGATEYFRVQTSTTSGQIVTTAAIPILFYINSTERMRIASTGTVSIGTTVSANALQVAGGAVQNTGIGNIGQFEMVYGSGSTWYNSGFRNDGNNAYFLVSAVQATQTAALTASYNSARPWTVNLASGSTVVGPPVTSTNALTVNGQSGANVAPLYVNGANTNGFETVKITDTANANGAHVYFIGNGATNPAKYLRVSGGVVYWINNANTSAIWQMDDTGLITQYNDALFSGSYGPTSALSIGYRGLPQFNPGGSWTGVLYNAGQSIIMGNAQTFTIPANSSVAYPIGTTLTIINSATGAGQNCTISSLGDTLYQANTSGTTGSRTLAPLGIATAIKTGSTTWVISGVGLS